MMLGAECELRHCRVDAQPLLQPLTRNWATGARLEFLNGYIEDYKAALTHPNREACSDLIDKIMNAWFEHFHWTLTVKEDPTVVKPRVPLGEGGFEHLSAEDSVTKGKVIVRMRTVSGLACYSISSLNVLISHSPTGSIIAQNELPRNLPKQPLPIPRLFFLTGCSV